MSDDAWTAWSRDVNRKLERLSGRVQLVEQGLLHTTNILRMEKGFDPIVSKRLPAPKPRHRVPAGTGRSW